MTTAELARCPICGIPTQRVRGFVALCRACTFAELDRRGAHRPAAARTAHHRHPSRHRDIQAVADVRAVEDDAAESSRANAARSRLTGVANVNPSSMQDGGTR
ncbi:MAG: hypothetical protein ABJB98_00495 [Actinomycetota bacterium]